VAALNAEAGRTERRLELQADIAKLADAVPAAAAKVADPGSAALSTYLAAIGFVIPSGRLSEWLVLVPVLALELGAALAVVLVQAVSGPPAAPETTSQVEQKVDSRAETQLAQPSSMPAATVDSKRPATKPHAVSKAKGRKRPSKRRLGQPSAVSKADAERRVVDLIKTKGGRLDDASVRGVAKLIGGRKSTVHSALAGLLAAGVVAKAGGALILAA
jgi:hypothetical protein